MSGLMHSIPSKNETKKTANAVLKNGATSHSADEKVTKCCFGGEGRTKVRLSVIKKHPKVFLKVVPL